MNKKLKTVFITKYALTKGIIECEMEVKNDNTYCFGDIYKNDKNIHGSKQGYCNSDFKLTKEDAILDAEKRKKSKLKSLEKQIERLQNLTF